MEIFDALSDKPIAFHPIFARISGGATAGLLLSQLVFWDKVSNGQEFYKTVDKITEETTLTRWEQETAIKDLKFRKFITVELKGIPAKRHFKINKSAIIEAIQLVSGKTSNLLEENQQTSSLETDKLYVEESNKENKEDIEENPQKENPENADIDIENFENLPEEYVVKMAIHHRLFKQVVRQEAQAAYNWIILKKAKNKYSDWNRFLHNWLAKRSIKEHAGEVPGVYTLNLEEGTLRRYHNEDGSVRVVSTYQEDLDDIKAGSLPPERLVENQLIELRKLKESGVTLTKIQEMDLADAEQSVPIRKNVHEKWLKGDYAGY